jgi:hypothetical protein
LTSSINADKNYNKSISFSSFAHWFWATYPQYFPQPMKIKQEQLDRLAGALLANYHAKELIALKATDSELKAKIMVIISHNFAEEEAIEEEARAMLASYARATKDVDPYKMFLLAKQKLAAKTGFIL